MLKKRILASSMASVMALSGVSVAAFAEDTAKDYGEAVTKAELKEYLDSFDKFITDELPTYGSTQGEKFQAALDHAKVVLEDEDSGEVEYAAAYQMVKAVRDSLAMHTKAELEALIKEYTGTREKNNILNEDIEDNVYTEASYEDFANAYDDAESYVDSEDSMLITDAYINLSNAISKLSKLNTVKKSEFRAALKDYEQIKIEAAKYETWRRGTITVTPTTGTSKNISNLKKIKMSMGGLEGVVFGNAASFDYWDGEQWKTIKKKDVSDDDKKDHDGQGRWIGSYDVAESDNVEDFINTQYDLFDDIKGATETSEIRIVAAYEAALDAVAVFNGWEEDNYKSGSKGKCATLEEKYHAQLVETFNYTNGVVGIKTVIEAFSDADNEYKVTYDVDKHTLKANKKVYVVKGKESGVMVDGSTVYKTEADAKDVAVTGESSVQSVSAGTNILKYVPSNVEAATIDTDYFEQYAQRIDKSDKDEDNDLTYEGDPVLLNAAALESLKNGAATPKKSMDVAGKVEVDKADAGSGAWGTWAKDGVITVPKALLAAGAKSDFVIKQYKAMGEADLLTKAAGSATDFKRNDPANYKGDAAVITAHNTLYKAVGAKMKAYYDAVDAGSGEAAAQTDLQNAVADCVEAKGFIDGDNFTGVGVKKVHTLSSTGVDGSGAYGNRKYYELKTGKGATAADKLAVKKNNEAIIALEAKAKNLDNAKYMADNGMEDYLAYLSYDFKDDDDKAEAQDIMDDLVRAEEAAPVSGSTREWTLIWRQLAYQLEDAYPESSTSSYTLPQLKALIDKAYEAAEATGDASLFAEKHLSLVDARQDAIDWYAIAKVTTGWKPSTVIQDQVIGDVYDTLKTEVDDLNKWLKDFQYSYEEIRTKIGEIAVAMDKGDVKATDELKKALTKCAEDLSVLEASDIYEGDGINPAFETDRTFQPANRLKTGNSKAGDKIKPNDFEVNLKKSYEALKKAYETALTGGETPSGVQGDVDGDGVVTFEDVNAVVAAFLAGKTDAKFDVNGDKTVDFEDVNKTVSLFLKANS